MSQSSVREMFAVPKELYFHVMNRATENQKQMLQDVNIDQMNVTCGPLLAGLKKDQKPAEEQETEQPDNQTVVNRNHPGHALMSTDKTPIYAHTLNRISTSPEDKEKTIKNEPPAAAAAAANPPFSKSQKVTPQIAPKQEPSKVKNEPSNKLNPINAPDLSSLPISDSIKPVPIVNPRKRSLSASASVKVNAPPKKASSLSDETEGQFSPDAAASGVPLVTLDTPGKPESLSNPDISLQSILQSAASNNLVSAQKRAFEELTPRKASGSAQADIEHEIYAEQAKSLKKSGNRQEMDEVLVSTNKQGKSPNVKAMSKRFSGSSFYAAPAPKTSNVTTRTRSEKAQATKAKRDELRRLGVKITTPEKKGRK